ncbi:branched-chain amino acid ABC transporter permease [Desertibacillus haloalkaliphilus]|uniref:branched-chain amino acid ABC transporter permease n=1 Tax=Desertibacillus haloalkaliphilus TaxID=1328930 RepID=UPI001C26C6AB|nr:branched-chain amino acid ABC transporter permease [Desertibacillus haloalkaliphilus]MBU8908206.1 branched-chain amino acid ABC transporter permease [Desertibacillus haloalkaliphilus]
MDIFGVVIVNGLSYGLLLFIITCGLSLVFGIMGVLNLAHGSMYMLAAYMAYTITTVFAPNFWVALLVAPILVGIIAFVLEIVLLRPTYHLGHLSQVLLTFGLAYIFHDLAHWIWGSNVLSLNVPEVLSGSVSLFGQTFPLYRISLIGFGILLAILLWLLQDKTRWGAIIRAGLTDKEMVSGLGINIKLVFTAVFILGGILAGIGGVVAAPILGLFPGMEFEILILALVVLVIGGLGSIAGTFVASILVGLVEAFSSFYFPQISLFVIFALMALILIVRPNGLLGKKVSG